MESKVLVVEHVSEYAISDGLQKKIDAALEEIKKKYKRKWFVHSMDIDILTWSWIEGSVRHETQRRFLKMATLVLHQEQKNGNHKK